jgi:hypothetical protein
MGGYMGYPDLSKSTTIGLKGAQKLAEEHGLEVELTDTGIKLIDPQGNTRTYKTAKMAKGGMINKGYMNGGCVMAGRGGKYKGEM